MYSNCYVYYLFIYGASKVQKSKNQFVRADVLFAELASDFGGELVVGGGPFREPPQSTVLEVLIGLLAIIGRILDSTEGDPFHLLLLD